MIKIKLLNQIFMTLSTLKGICVMKHTILRFNRKFDKTHKNDLND